MAAVRPYQPPTKLPSNESTIPTLNPLRVDRDPALRGAGLFAVALGAWGLDAVTAGVCHSNSIVICYLAFEP